MTIQKAFKRASLLARLESGPLGSALADLEAALGEQRYATRTIQKYLQAADAFGQWLITQKIELRMVDEQIVSQFVDGLERRVIPPRQRRPSHLATGWQHLLTVLRRQGVIEPPRAIVPDTPGERFLAQYKHYLAGVLGSAPATLSKHLLFAKRLLAFAFKSQTLDWQSLRGDTLTQFILQQTERRSGGGRKAPAHSVRVLLRYLVARGDIRPGLSAAIPKVREWKHASLPTYLSEAEIAQVLAACARETAMGKRNYTILLLLARLGLRACEVVSLRINDIDWAAGAITIRSNKTHRERRLPLTQEVGHALIEYLRHGRAKGMPHREIFLTQDAPFSPFRDSSAVGAVVRREMKRAHLARQSARAHLFRHTAATQMVRRGASFKEIADVLGHQALQTTALYAKLDLAALSQVALPWPGGAQ
jgi:site-specific recombinase XerD